MRQFARPIVILFLMLAALGPAGCGGGLEDAPEEINPASKKIAYYDTFNFYNVLSSCEPENDYYKTLSIYYNEDETYFELRGTNDALYLYGDVIDDDELLSYKSTISGESADCLIRLTGLADDYDIEEECHSENFSCYLYWQ